MELKHDLRKLDGSYYHYFGNGLNEYKLTACDTEFDDIPEMSKRPEHIQERFDSILKNVKEQKELLAQKGKSYPKIF